MTFPWSVYFGTALSERSNLFNLIAKVANTVDDSKIELLLDDEEEGLLVPLTDKVRLSANEFKNEAEADPQHFRRWRKKESNFMEKRSLRIFRVVPKLIKT